MSVRRAAQVFSHSAASALDLMSHLGRTEAGAKDTAIFCSTVNDMFDSLNSLQLMNDTVPLRSAVTKNSNHLSKWAEYRTFLKSITFETEKITIPCLKDWQITLSAMQQLVPYLLYQLFSVMMNRFSQDALKNLFSLVRSDFVCVTVRI